MDRIAIINKITDYLDEGYEKYNDGNTTVWYELNKNNPDLKESVAEYQHCSTTQGVDYERLVLYCDTGFTDGYRQIDIPLSDSLPVEISSITSFRVDQNHKFAGKIDTVGDIVIRGDSVLIGSHIQGAHQHEALFIEMKKDSERGYSFVTAEFNRDNMESNRGRKFKPPTNISKRCVN